jgi:IclR family transcriptional regulator, pca regulon regulatory protein
MSRILCPGSAEATRRLRTDPITEEEGHHASPHRQLLIRYARSCPGGARARRGRRQGRQRRLPRSQQSLGRGAARRSPALAKGLRILSLFNEQRPSWRVSDLATAAGLPMPTVYRVVMTLASEGYLDHLPNGDYRPGVRTLTLGTAALRSLDLVAIATPKLQELGERTGETVNLAVLSGDRVLYLIRLRNSDLVTANIQVGSTLPAVHTSIGKLLLAYLDEADLQSRITDASFAANSGPNAKVSLAELRDELRTIRDQGWAMQDEELAYGLRSVAAPITAPDGRVLAGVNLAVQAQDWSTQRIIRELRPAVLATCAEISGLLSDTTAGSL